MKTPTDRPSPSDEKQRCLWAGTDPLYVRYHDTEWGVPVQDERTLFEFLILEGAQAGLSWITILKRREGYRECFEGFDPERVARFSPARIEQVLKNPKIIRNRLKVHSAVTNAQAFLRVQAAFGGFAAYQWGFVNGAPLQNRRKRQADVPPTTAVSDAWSKDMKKRGFRFVGSTILYAHMQAVGMVNDHLDSCFRQQEVRALGQRFCRAR